ncbi:flavoprotein [Streptomyces spiramenti]|uniref:Flavoprotein n=1 Tax=Streptomyces spiramenti TaxID=2720606 RepID=A0ABX1AQR9_9ACTN|nr:flavoprotein [Streptomyces spiramenti]NJP67038.1 flavoprotein [Streptomyces spiramenti]
MRTLHLLGCAAPPVQYLADGIRQAQTRGWQVCVGLTPTAGGWVGADRLAALEELTGHPVRTQPRPAGLARHPWPDADAVVVAPATLNTVNSLALGLTPHQVAGTAMKAVGGTTPLVVLPCINTDLAGHPQWGRSVDVLRGVGVRVLVGDGGWVPHPPGKSPPPEEFPWGLALDALP